MSTSTTIHPEGTTVRVSERSICGDPSIDESAARADREFEVYSYATSEEGDDPNGRPYYLLDVAGMSYGGNYWAYPEFVEVVRTADQNAARKPPPAAEVRNAVASEVIGLSRDFEVHQIDNSGDNRFHVQATTHDGLEFQFRVTVDQIEEVEW